MVDKVELIGWIGGTIIEEYDDGVNVGEGDIIILEGGLITFKVITDNVLNAANSIVAVPVVFIVVDILLVCVIIVGAIIVEGVGD